MKRVRVRNSSSNTILADKAELADTFFLRLAGLMGRESVPAGGGMVITPCNSIHTMFMRFPIDVVFYGEGGKVVSTVSGLRPYRATRIHRGARGVVELPSGTLAEMPVSEGDVLVIEPVAVENA